MHLPGLKMHYVEKGDRSNPLMIFVHGFPAFWFSWRHQLDYFSKDYWLALGRYIYIYIYRVVQMYLTEEVEEFCVLFDRCHCKNMTKIKQRG